MESSEVVIGLVLEEEDEGRGVSSSPEKVEGARGRESRREGSAVQAR